MNGVYDVHKTTQTAQFGGEAWVVDGEVGRMLYPTTLSKDEAVRMYRIGESVPSAYTELLETLVGPMEV